jgi:hypothetical protein
VAPPYSERILDYSEFNLLSGRAAKSQLVLASSTGNLAKGNGLYPAIFGSRSGGDEYCCTIHDRAGIYDT